MSSKLGKTCSMIFTAGMGAMIQPILSTASTPTSTSPSLRSMTDAQIEMAFLEWWKESYPLAPANKQAISMHVAFASHVLALAELYKEYETPSATND